MKQIVLSALCAILFLAACNKKEPQPVAARSVPAVLPLECGKEIKIGRAFV